MTKALAAAAAVLAAFPLFLILLVTASTGTPAQAAPAATGLTGTPTGLAISGIPADYLAWYMAAAKTCPGLPWSVLAGIGEVESDHGRSTLPGIRSGANSAGAEGPMQFEPATFSQFAVNADPGQPLSPYDPADAIYTAAAMLCASGARGGSPAGLQNAVFAYNHAQWYVSEVMAWAAKYATQGGSHVVSHRDHVRRAATRQAVPVGRGRAGRLRLLRPGLRRLRRRRHPHRPHHLPVAARRPRRPAVPDPARRPAVQRGQRRHRGRPRPRRHVPRQRPGHPGKTNRRTRPGRPGRPGERRRGHPPRRPGKPAMTSTDPSQLSPGGTPMPAEPSPAHEPAARPDAAAQALRDAASAVAAAWEQPMDPDAYSRAVSQLYSVLRDLGIAIRGLARYQVIPVPPGPADRGFAQHATTSAAWLLGAWHSLDGVVAAEGLGPLPSPARPGDVLCQAARDTITAWRQPSGTAADRDSIAGQLITAIVYLSEATLGLAGYAPRHRTIDLYAVGAGLAEARVALASAIQIPAGQAIRHRGQAATGYPGGRE